MRSYHIVFLVLQACTVYAYPARAVRQPFTRRQQNATANIDATILQFALTLEHLENAFYKAALSMFKQQDFVAAGFGADYLNNIQLIASDENQHVDFLSSALTTSGAQPVAPCTYNFPMTDVLSFIGLSSILEGIGTSAYLGGAPLITSKSILTAAGSILVTEALHTSLQRSAVKAAPGPNPFGTPLDPSAVFSLATSFITECPASNAPLPFAAFPALKSNQPPCTCEGPDCSSGLFQKRETHVAPLMATCIEPFSKAIRTQDECVSSTVAQGGANSSTSSLVDCRPPSAGDSVSFTAAHSVPAGSFVTFVSGLVIVSVAAQGNESTVFAAVPQGIAGQAYVMVTKTDLQGKFDAGSVLFGPAVLEGKLFPPP